MTTRNVDKTSIKNPIRLVANIYFHCICVIAMQTDLQPLFIDPDGGLINKPLLYYIGCLTRLYFADITTI